MQSKPLVHLLYVLLQLCLLAKCFKPALPFLEVDMMDICKENGAYDAKHFLCYYYYGGMIYTGLKNFERALYFYEQVLSLQSFCCLLNLNVLCGITAHAFVFNFL